MLIYGLQMVESVEVIAMQLLSKLECYDNIDSLHFGYLSSHLQYKIFLIFKMRFVIVLHKEDF